MAGPLRTDGRCDMGAGCDCEHSLGYPDDRPDCINWTPNPALMNCPYCGCDCDTSAVGDHALDCRGYGENAETGPDEPPADERLAIMHAARGGKSMSVLWAGLVAASGINN